MYIFKDVRELRICYYSQGCYLENYIKKFIYIIIETPKNVKYWSQKILRRKKNFLKLKSTQKIINQLLLQKKTSTQKLYANNKQQHICRDTTNKTTLGFFFLFHVVPTDILTVQVRGDDVGKGEEFKSYQLLQKYKKNLRQFQWQIVSTHGVVYAIHSSTSASIKIKQNRESTLVHDASKTLES